MSEQNATPPGPTPSQTVGPFLSLGMTWEDGAEVVAPGTPGTIRIGGIVRDGAGDPVSDAVVETWQADPQGHFDHPEDPAGAGEAPSVAGFRGFGRCATDGSGNWEIRTLKPGAIAGQAPHIDVSLFARGLLDRVVTRIYFPDEDAANAADPLLALVPPERRATLVAVPAGPDRLRFDINLQGAAETVFLSL